MKLDRNQFIFLFFFISGFCGLLYQVVWMRLAFASFGVITPVMSVVISVFMLGLAFGSWAGGRWIAAFRDRYRTTSLVFYSATELTIGLGAFLVPVLFKWGEKYLMGMGEMNSFQYLLSSAAILGMTILPWCILMGFTFPFMMSFVREVEQKNTTSFSYLYLANVIGAACGTLITAVVLIELLGFKHTLLLAACLNFAVAIMGFSFARAYPYEKLCILPLGSGGDVVKSKKIISNQKAKFICALLFVTGFISMSMEVVWVRAFTPVLKTKTYSFAGLLTVYLLATWVGSFYYRRHLSKKSVIPTSHLLGALSIFSFFPIVLNDPRLAIGVGTILGSIIPFCAALGYLTPKLIDQYSTGRPFEAGKAYAINVLGCILGPLFAAYTFLPSFGVKISLILLALPFMVFFILKVRTELRKMGWASLVAVISLFFYGRASFVSESYEEVYAAIKGSEIRRDYTATVVSYGSGFGKKLLVNGIGMTHLTVITKFMAHLPLAFHTGKPQSSLVICFGMGTTYRSLLSWGIHATAVELTPGVFDAFGYYFDDAAQVRLNPKGKLVVDDGRRYLKRTAEKFDVITIDPPPPIETAGSSLLYSEGFYQDVKMRLAPGGILQAWFPGSGEATFQAFARSLTNSFPHVKMYHSIEGWGFHFIASMEPIEAPTAEEMFNRMPKLARADLMEWFADKENMKQLLQKMLSHEIPIGQILSANPDIVIKDDRPFNEYYILRQSIAKANQTFRIAR